MTTLYGRSDINSVSVPETGHVFTREPESEVFAVEVERDSPDYHALLTYGFTPERSKVQLTYDEQRAADEALRMNERVVGKMAEAMAETAGQVTREHMLATSQPARLI